MGLISVIVFVRSVGLPRQADRNVYAARGGAGHRLRIAFLATLWGGPVIFLIGQGLREGWLNDTGLVVWCAALPVFVAKVAVDVTHLRRVRSKQISTDT